MKQTSRIISIYAADTSGVCSALYELGGMTVVHDASGCNSTYATHDEPRWYDRDSMIYISALTEIDAIMGNDEKLITDISLAAADLQPRFIALCGSPMPMMTGTDFDAIAAEIQAQTGIQALPLHTNGMHSYLMGEAEAFEALAKSFCADVPKTAAPSANIIGLTPLDFSLNGTAESMIKWLADNEIDLVSSFAMGSSLDEIANAGSAWVNLVVSYGGLSAAKYMKKRFGIPYVCGVPYGEKFAAALAERLKNPAAGAYSCAERSSENASLAIVGESISAGSLAAAIEADFGTAVKVLCPLETEDVLLARGDVLTPDEDDSAAAFSRLDGVIADPLYKPICPEATRFYPLPHEAFSGRCFAKSIPNLICGRLL